MKKLAFVSAAFFIALLLYAFTKKESSEKEILLKTFPKPVALLCSPDIGLLSPFLDELDIPIMPGTGNWQWQINTASDSAQVYFNQGMNMYYGFHIIEALASFKKAARFDSESPMIWWAQALALGPNINNFGYSASPEALQVTGKAKSFLQNASPSEKALINAMALRYSADTLQKREKLNQDYADALKQAVNEFPNVADIGVLYADALMLQHPWDLWSIDGKPKAWTPAIEKLLESVLASSPLHPGANHYYIHVMEASPFALKASASANRLASLTPGLAHLVHMPSHIFLRTGNFHAGLQTNVKAIDTYKKYRELFPVVSTDVFLYEWHNQHMQANCAIMAGRYQDAITVANDIRRSIDTSMLSTPAPFGSIVQYIYMTKMLVNIRFEKWDSILLETAPRPQDIYSNILFHFSRGMANTARKDFEEAGKNLDTVKSLMVNAELKIPLTPFSSAYEGAATAFHILSGEILMGTNKHNEGLQHLADAVKQEENMVYNEPRDWLLNPKQYLGAAYLKSNRFAEAEAAFKKDLEVNNKNVWSLRGLQKALQKQTKLHEASLIKKEFEQASNKSDVNFSALLYK